MNKEFYEAMRDRVETGKYKMEDILKDLNSALGKGLLDIEKYDELKAMAETKCDPTYEGNKIATSYDNGQDIEILANTMATLENFELIVVLEQMVEAMMPKTRKVSEDVIACLTLIRSAIGDNYVRMIIEGYRTFESVPLTKKQEVADKLIAMGRQDLVTDPDYIPVVEQPVVDEANGETIIDGQKVIVEDGKVTRVVTK